MVISRQNDVAAPRLDGMPLQRLQQVELRWPKTIPVITCRQSKWSITSAGNNCSRYIEG
jgi:hypothetical protein